MAIKNKLLDNVTVVIRYSGEATLVALKNQVLAEVAEENIHIIEEAPFSKAVEKNFAIGIEKDKKWTLALDADLILAPNAISLMIEFAEKYDGKLYVYQGCVLDKFRCSIRQGGPHLYLTKNLKSATSKLIVSETELRPESKLYKEMAKDGCQIIIDKKLFALHDFFQNHEDVYRKGYFHGIKHKRWKSLLPLWLEKSKIDDNYKLAAIGFIDSYFHANMEYPDAETIKSIGRKKAESLDINKPEVSIDIRSVFSESLSAYNILVNSELDILKNKKPLMKKIKDKFKSL